MTPARTYLIHGLRFRSELPLSEPEAADGPLDLQIELRDPTTIPDSPPEGETIVELELPGLEYAIVRDPSGGYTARFPSLCEFRITADLRAISVHAARDADHELIGALLIGNVLAFLLGMAGKTVLHASAVELDGSAIAVLGVAGAGKSTLAAHLCMAGARLVTDDTMRVGVEGSDAHCFEGTHHVRLRPGAAALANRFEPELRTLTGDGRIALSLPPSHDPRPRLEALVFPKLSPGAEAVEVRRLAAREGVIRLIANSRLIGWRRAEELRPAFQTFARLTEALPILEAQIPWGDEQPSGLGEELLARIRSECPIATSGGRG